MGGDVRKETPVVSICLITYNHASYIRECLDSLLGQETSFPYEICIGEDESSDGTREICVEYAERYPDKIRLALRSQAEPVRKQFLSQGVYNYIETTKECRGKYVAMCDGDDLWIHTGKLQKQVDAMEADPSIALVHTGYDVLDEVTGRRVSHIDQTRARTKGCREEIAQVRFDLICRSFQIASSTTLMRTADVLDTFEKNQEAFRLLPMGDTQTWCELLNYGSFHYIDESMALYRILCESCSNSTSAEKKFCFVNGASNLGIMLGGKYKLPMEGIRANKIKNCNRYALLSGDVAEIKALHANPDFSFPLREQLIYWVGIMPVLHHLARLVFEIRFRLNNYRFRTS